MRIPSLSFALSAGALLLAFAVTQAPAQGQAIVTTRIANGFASPVFACSPPGDMDRLFVVQRGGQIRIVDDLYGNPTRLATPFLTVSGVTSGGEQGLLGMAFHPDYANNGRFFVNFTASGGGATTVREYTVSTADPNVANPTPVQTLLTIAQPFSNHNGGCIQFGADDMLYVGTGDGGSGGDPGDRAQNPTNLLGKMLRLDVDLPFPHIPPTNPFYVSPTIQSGLIWATGLRNPWRFSFDSLNGDMYIGDVGQNAWEEVSYQPGTSTGGENYGWRCMEGNHCFSTSPHCACNNSALTGPIQEYSHSNGCSITGGVVYRGSKIPALDGTYFYADYCTSRIWSFTYDGTTLTNFTDRTSELAPATGSITSISSFAEDGRGEVYIMEVNGGEIYRIEPDCDTTAYCTANPNSTGQIGQLFSIGSLSVSDNNFILLAANLPVSQFTYCLAGTASGFVPNPGGSNGNFCLGGSGARFGSQIGQTDFLGTYQATLDLTNFPTNPASVVQAGETWYFQAWHRENGGQSNFTTGLSALFCP
ncbi:MAG: PQQ-dependent sugar dehydrogenase [Planctomycetota bacterium]|nr:PQQ-dependent sugar dehydrogenase [Planctomycetota bacterium]